VVGLPAIAIGPQVVATGSVEELRAVVAWSTGTVATSRPTAPPVPEDVLADAAIALVVHGSALAARAAPADRLADIEAVVLSAEDDGERGQLVLVRRSEGTQQDAVDLAVRVRTDGPLGATGAPLLVPGAPLTRGRVVVLDVEWSADPAAVLPTGLGPGLLDFLGR
jgi:hypothetical protein